MRTETLGKLALTVAAVSLIGNYLQFLHARELTKSHQLAMNRVHIDNRQKAMQARADAFHALVLDRPVPAPHAEKNRTGADRYDFEYAVKVPEQKESEFLEWMAGVTNEPFPRMSVHGGFAHESALRVVNDNGREVQEIYEKFSLTFY